MAAHALTLDCWLEWRKQVIYRMALFRSRHIVHKSLLVGGVMWHTLLLIIYAYSANLNIFALIDQLCTRVRHSCTIVRPSPSLHAINFAVMLIYLFTMP